MAELAAPSGADRIIAEALDAAPQAILAFPDAALALTDELAAACQGPALAAVLAARVEQIAVHGHDAAHDELLPIGRLPRLAREILQSASDVIDATAERRNLPVARKRMARVAAICMAAIDRLDMTKGNGGQ